MIKPTWKVERKRPESKSRRVSIVCRPSLFEKFEKVAYMQGESFNNAISLALQMYVDVHIEDLERYNELERNGGVDKENKN